MISGGIAGLLSPRITEYETQSGKQTQLKWIFTKKAITIWNLNRKSKLNCLQNLASCGIAHSIGIKKFCGINRWPNSLKRGKNNKMSKQTEYLVIGIGIASILAGIYGAVRTGNIMESLSGVVIGIALIGTIIIERNKKSKSE